MRKSLIVGAAVTATGLVVGVIGAFGLGGSADASTKKVHHSRPHATRVRPGVLTAHATNYPVTPFSQQFGANTKLFCPTGSGNAACDGAVGDYGTIDRVQSGFSNGGAGNYAPSTPALAGHHFDLVSGSQTVNQGLDCPEPSVSEYCTGPYALFGNGAAAGAENEFPANGFTVTNDLYLSPGTIGPVNTIVNDDVELNTSTGAYGQDNTTWTCETAAGIEVSFDGDCSGSSSANEQALVTTAGWYRFVFVFSKVDGAVYLTQSVWAESSSPTTTAPSLVLQSAATPEENGSISDNAGNWGGPGYFWMFQDDVSGVGLANFALQLGSHSEGHTP